MSLDNSWRSQFMRVSAIHLSAKSSALFCVFSSSVAFGDTFPKSWGRLWYEVVLPPLCKGRWVNMVNPEGLFMTPAASIHVPGQFMAKPILARQRNSLTTLPSALLRFGCRLPLHRGGICATVKRVLPKRTFRSARSPDTMRRRSGDRISYSTRSTPRRTAGSSIPPASP